jgi:hypothetical protein
MKVLLRGGKIIKINRCESESQVGKDCVHNLSDLLDLRRMITSIGPPVAPLVLQPHQR